MAIIGPWSAVNGRVYHNNSGCRVGNHLPMGMVRFGTREKPLCIECHRLSGLQRSKFQLNTAFS